MAEFQRGLNFPHEGFVQGVIEKYFNEQGYRQIKEGHSDLVCVREETKWVVEAKGVTTDIGLDFRTGLGQLVQRMVEPETNYAIAVPQTPQFIKQCSQIPKWVRVSLNIHFLLIDEQGNVQTISPHEDL
ncbi:MAG: hypothetical protein EOM62_13090 [Bacteroidia bacterium]|nr:hypothetical protein [Bacteroidia bacterium]